MPDVYAVNQAPTARPLEAAPGPTQEQLMHMYQYSNALKKDAMTPVKHWTQGVGNMVSALMGGWLGNEANKQKAAAIGAGVEGKLPIIPPPAVPGPGAPDDAPAFTKPALPAGASSFAPEEGSNPVFASLGNTKEAPELAPTMADVPLPKPKPKALPSISDSLIDRADATTQRQESGGRFDNVTTTRNRKGQLQSALGAYGIMDFNVGPWSREALGRELTPQEFLADADAQRAIYKYKMGQYIAKHGVENAGRAWLGGEGGIKFPDRRDPLGTSIGSYGKKFAQGVGAGGPQSDMPGVAAAPLPFLTASGGAIPFADEGAVDETPNQTKAMLAALTKIDPDSAIPMKGGLATGMPMSVKPPLPSVSAPDASVPLPLPRPPGITADVPLPPVKPVIPPTPPPVSRTPVLPPVPAPAPNAVPTPAPVPTPGPVKVAQAVSKQWDPEPHLPPAQIPTIPRYTREQVRRAMLSQTLTPAQEGALIAAYNQQFQPIDVPVPGGFVRVNPNNYNQQKFYKTVNKGTEKTGTIETLIFQTTDPWAEEVDTLRDKVTPAPVPQAVTPQPVPQPAPRPTVPPLPNVPVIPVKPGAPTPITPDMLSPTGPRSDLPGGPTVAEAPVPPPGPVTPPVRLAAANTGTMSDAPPIGAAPPMGAAGPSPAEIAASALPTTPPPGMAPGPQTAQIGLPTNTFTLPNAPPPPVPSVPGATPDIGGSPTGISVPAPVGKPPGLRDSTWQKYMAVQEQGVQQAGQLKEAEKDAELNAKRYSDMNTEINKTRTEVRPALEQALAQLDKPQFNSGILNDPILTYKRSIAMLAQSFPDLAKKIGLDPDAARPNEVFAKGIAGAILANMGKALEGLGQVRVAEIDLLKKAMASPQNTINANRTLLNMALKVLDRGDAIATMAQDYKAGVPVVNYLSPNKEVILPAAPGGKGRSLDVGFDRLINQLTNDHPVFTPEQIQDQANVWKESAATPPPEPKKYLIPNEKNKETLRQNSTDPAYIERFEQHYGPHEKYLKKK